MVKERREKKKTKERKQTSFTVIGNFKPRKHRPSIKKFACCTDSLFVDFFFFFFFFRSLEECVIRKKMKEKQ